MASAVALVGFSLWVGGNEFNFISLKRPSVPSGSSNPPPHVLFFSQLSHISDPHAESRFITFSDVPTAAPGEIYSILICSTGPLVPGH